MPSGWDTPDLVEDAQCLTDNYHKGALNGHFKFQQGSGSIGVISPEITLFPS